MLGDGLSNSGTKGSWFKFQWGALKLLERISGSGLFQVQGFTNATFNGLMTDINTFIDANPTKTFRSTSIVYNSGAANFSGTVLYN